MTVTSIHVFTTGSTQWDLRQVVAWTVDTANSLVLVQYRGSPQEQWVQHASAAWLAAKATSLGTSIAASPHIFNINNTYWDVRFAVMWVTDGATVPGIYVYYEGAQDATKVFHASLSAWEAKKTASLGAGG